MYLHLYKLRDYMENQKYCFHEISINKTLSKHNSKKSQTIYRTVDIIWPINLHLRLHLQC